MSYPVKIKKVLVSIIVLGTLALPIRSQAAEYDARDLVVQKTTLSTQTLSANDCTLLYPYFKQDPPDSLYFESDDRGSIKYFELSEQLFALKKLVFVTTNVTADDRLRLANSFINDAKRSYIRDEVLAFCPQDNAFKINMLSIEDEQGEKHFIGKNLIIWTLYQMILLSSKIGLWLLGVTGELLGGLLTVGQFVTNPFVRTGWPFLQGFANIGFIVALLFIAFSTTLNLQIGGDPRKLLPRLLIAALLINFSLVIGGILIDTSRLFMASLTAIMSGGLASTDQIGPAIITASDLLSASFHSIGGGEDPYISLSSAKDSWAALFQAWQAVILIWALAFGFVLVSALLFVRWIALILLLIISPMAYLAAAMPGMNSFASWWWKQFLHWVIYGPIALFMLLLITRVPSIPNPIQGFFGSLLNVLITVAMLVATFMVGKKVSAIGAQGALNFVTKTGKKAGSELAKRPALAGAIAGGILTGGLAAPVGAAAGAGAVALGRAGGRFVGQQASDAGRTLKSNLASYIPKGYRTVERDKEGKPMKGQPKTFGERFGGFIPKKLEEKQQARVDAAKSVAKHPNGTLVNPANTVKTSPVFASASLRDTEVKRALGIEAVKNVLSHAEQPSQIQAVLGDKDFMMNVSDDDKLQMIQIINSRPDGSLKTGPAQQSRAELRRKNYSEEEIDQIRGRIAAETSLSEVEQKAKMVNQLMDSLNKPTS